MNRRLAIISIPYAAPSAERQNLLIGTGVVSDGDPLTPEIRGMLPPEFADVRWVANHHDVLSGLTDVLVTRPDLPLVPIGLQPPRLLTIYPPSPQLPDSEPCILLARVENGPVYVICAEDERSSGPVFGKYRDLLDGASAQFAALEADMGILISARIRMRVCPCGTPRSLIGTNVDFGPFLARHGYHSPVCRVFDDEEGVAIYAAGTDIWPVSPEMVEAALERATTEVPARD